MIISKPFYHSNTNISTKIKYHTEKIHNLFCRAKTYHCCKDLQLPADLSQFTNQNSIRSQNCIDGISSLTQNELNYNVPLLSMEGPSPIGNKNSHIKIISCVILYVSISFLGFP